MNQTFGPDRTDPSNGIFMPRKPGSAADHHATAFTFGRPMPAARALLRQALRFNGRSPLGGSPYGRRQLLGIGRLHSSSDRSAARELRWRRIGAARHGPPQSRIHCQARTGDLPLANADSEFESIVARVRCPDGAELLAVAR